MASSSTPATPGPTRIRISRRGKHQSERLFRTLGGVWDCRSSSTSIAPAGNWPAKPLAQRLRDKGHNWQDLQQLIPDALALGLMGYAFMCPDMIGGGEYSLLLQQPGQAARPGAHRPFGSVLGADADDAVFGRTVARSERREHGDLP